MEKVINAFSEKAKSYLKSVNIRKVFPEPEDIEKMKYLDIPLQDYSIEPLEVIDELDKFGAPATVASTANKYFGFVIGGGTYSRLFKNALAFRPVSVEKSKVIHKPDEHMLISDLIEFTEVYKEFLRRVLL